MFKRGLSMPAQQLCKSLLPCFSPLCFNEAVSSLSLPRCPFVLQRRVPCCAAVTVSTVRECVCATVVGRGWSVTSRRRSASTPSVVATAPAATASAPAQPDTVGRTARKVRACTWFIHWNQHLYWPDTPRQLLR